MNKMGTGLMGVDVVLGVRSAFQSVNGTESEARLGLHKTTSYSRACLNQLHGQRIPD
jgi:hypothetical protein